MTRGGAKELYKGLEIWSECFLSVQTSAVGVFVYLVPIIRSI